MGEINRVYIINQCDLINEVDHGDDSSALKRKSFKSRTSKTFPIRSTAIQASRSRHPWLPGFGVEKIFEVRLLDDGVMGVFSNLS